MMWAAGAVAAMSSITFPAISALVSRNAESDQQGEHWMNLFILNDVPVQKAEYSPRCTF